MHKISAKEFTIEDFSCENLFGDYEKLAKDTIKVLNVARENYLKTKSKGYWWQMIQLLPSTYNQTRNLMINYEVANNIYHQRKNHKLPEWRSFCDVLEKLPYSQLITMDFGEEK